jgi:molybdate transport system ATP-binding protein
MRVFLVTSDAADLPSSFDHILGINNHSVIAQGPRDAVLASLSQQSSQNKPADAPKTLIHPPSDREKASDIVIQMRNVTITYNGTHILRGVNWQVARGDRWALLGHNGAGKTTLLSLIMGDNPQAYANEIELFGMRRGSGESIWEIKRRIGWMAPELHRYYPPVYKCFDVVCSGWFDSIGLYRKYNESQSNAVYAVMDDLNIGKLAQQQFRHVSETEQRLVLLARALVKHPQLLILDEPSQGLDRRNRQLVYQVLDKTTHWADSLILVTHQTHDLPQCITHILTLRKGQSISQRARHSESQ